MITKHMNNPRMGGTTKETISRAIPPFLLLAIAIMANTREAINNAP